MTVSVAQGAKPLCVDLDGTLVRTDTLHECVIRLVKSRPLTAIRMFGWLRRGRAGFKDRLAQHVDLRPDRLPFNDQVLTYLRSERQSGREIYLVTGAHRRIADAIGAHLGIFSGIVGTDGGDNLVGATKAGYLCARFGERGFAYAGNAYIDRKVWRVAAESVAVELSWLARRLIAGDVAFSRAFGHPGVRLVHLLRAVRVHQWVKNLLIFVPLLLAHRVPGIDALAALALGFLAFCLTSSSVYVLNDLMDLDADRLHPEKRHRPFAAGDLSLLSGAALFPVLLALGLGLGYRALGLPFFFCLVAYYGVTLTYSMWAKRVPILDVVVLAVLYASRIFAGGVASGVTLTPWLLAFAVFMFFSLALAKRTAELVRLKEAAEGLGRGYLAKDLLAVAACGIGSGLQAVQVLALYINSDLVQTLYRTPQYLWGVCLVLMYWLALVWLLVLRGEMPHDPIVFALKDRRSLLLGAAAGVLILLASLT